MLSFIKSILNPGISCSSKFKLDLTDFKKLIRTSLFVGGAASTAYIVSNLNIVHFDSSQENSTMNSVLILVLTIIFESINRYLKNNSTGE